MGCGVLGTESEGKTALERGIRRGNEGGGGVMIWDVSSPTVLHGNSLGLFPDAVDAHTQPHSPAPLHLRMHHDCLGRIGKVQRGARVVHRACTAAEGKRGGGGGSVQCNAAHMLPTEPGGSRERGSQMQCTRSGPKSEWRGMHTAPIAPSPAVGPPLHPLLRSGPHCTPHPPHPVSLT